MDFTPIKTLEGFVVIIGSILALFTNTWFFSAFVIVAYILINVPDIARYIKEQTKPKDNPEI